MKQTHTFTFRPSDKIGFSGKRFTAPAFPCPVCGTPTAHLFCSDVCAVAYFDLSEDEQAALRAPGLVHNQKAVNR